MKTKVISFASGKGGVGKTTLVANLGSLWAKSGSNTLLVDGDWSLGKLSLTLGVRPQWTVEKVLSGEIGLAEAVHSVSKNLSLLASPSGIIGLEELSEAARNQIFFEMEDVGRQYDTILFDHSSGLNWGVLQFAAASHQHVIVTTSEPTSYTDAYAIMKILSKRFAIRNFSLLVTMSQNLAETEAIISRFADVARSHLDVRVTLLEIFPWEPKLAESIRKQRLFIDLYPNEKLTRCFDDVRVRLENEIPSAHQGLRFFCEEQELPQPTHRISW